MAAILSLVWAAVQEEVCVAVDAQVPGAPCWRLTKKPLPGLLVLQGVPDRAPMYTDYLANKHEYGGVMELTRAHCYKS